MTSKSVACMRTSTICMNRHHFTSGWTLLHDVGFSLMCPGEDSVLIDSLSKSLFSELTFAFIEDQRVVEGGGRTVELRSFCFVLKASRNHPYLIESLSNAEISGHGNWTSRFPRRDNENFKFMAGPLIARVLHCVSTGRVQKQSCA
jgi:hypothetical protein